MLFCIQVCSAAIYALMIGTLLFGSLFIAYFPAHYREKEIGLSGESWAEFEIRKALRCLHMDERLVLCLTEGQRFNWELFYIATRMQKKNPSLKIKWTSEMAV